MVLGATHILIHRRLSSGVALLLGQPWLRRVCTSPCRRNIGCLFVSCVQILPAEDVRLETDEDGAVQVLVALLRAVWCVTDVAQFGMLCNMWRYEIF